MRIDISKEQSERINELIKKYTFDYNEKAKKEGKITTPEQEEEIERIINGLIEEGRLHDTPKKQSDRQEPNSKITTPEQEEKIKRIIYELIKEGRLHKIKEEESHQKTR